MAALVTSGGYLTMSVVIPALDEEASIAEIVSRVKATEPELRAVGIAAIEIIVVDDGSTDRTAEIAASLPDVVLVRHSRTRGYGAALKTGFSRARGELLAFLDADGTYPPENLPQLCRATLEQGADIVVGSRRSGSRSKMPFLRRIGNQIWSALVSLIGGSRCVDPASGMRVLRRSVLPRIYPLPDGLNFTPVMSTRAIHEGLKVLELPIPYAERAGHSKLNVIEDGTRFLRTILWTSMEYNPSKVLGLLGAVFVGLAVAIGLVVVLMRVQGVTTLGIWGAFSLFAVLILGVLGVSIYSLGITFGVVASFFHGKPMRQGMFRHTLVEQRLEPQFGWLGAGCIGIGFLLVTTCLVLGGKGWEIGRIWLWFLGSALFILVGFQLIISWALARVVGGLAERGERIDQELRGDRAAPSPQRKTRKAAISVADPPATLAKGAQP